jgi:gas vesicle protein
MNITCIGGDICQDNIKGVFGMENELSSIVEHFNPVFEALRGKIEQWAEHCMQHKEMLKEENRQIQKQLRKKRKK